MIKLKALPMAIPSEIVALIERLNQELNETEQEAIKGVNIVRQGLSFFPNNVTLTRYFAYFNNALFLVEVFRRRIQSAIATISPENVTDEEIQETGEDLGEILGRVLETKIGIRGIIRIFEE
ncbi:hypothetical protein [Aerosakkonema funiforme]|uniref:hypothetical protein n=1 Tax=Aerosakkonema funiforme TaxID=1246630 RepID=UPI0035BA0C5B